MSDPFRQSLGDQVHSSVKPESQKGFLEKAADTFNEYGDKAAAAIQPGDSKSTSQKLSDDVRYSGGSSVGNQAAAMGQNVSAQASAATQSVQQSASSTAQDMKSQILEARDMVQKEGPDVLEEAKQTAVQARAETNAAVNEQLGTAQAQGESLMKDLKEGWSDVVGTLKETYAELTTKTEGTTSHMAADEPKAAVPAAEGPGILASIQSTATSVFQNISETATNLTAKASETVEGKAPATEPGAGNSVLAQMQGAVASAYGTTSKTLGNLAEKVFGEDDVNVKDNVVHPGSTTVPSAVPTHVTAGLAPSAGAGPSTVAGSSSVPSDYR